MSPALKKKDLNLNLTLKIYPYLSNDLSFIEIDLNKLYFSLYSAEQISQYLFATHRNKKYGFNLSLSLDYLIFMFERLTSNNRDIDAFILPKVKEFVEKKAKDIDILKINDLELNLTRKVYPYLRKRLNSTEKKLNQLLFRVYSEKEIYHILFSKRRKNQYGFNKSLTIDFLIFMFNSLYQKDNDRKSILIPNMQEFVTEKKLSKIEN